MGLLFYRAEPVRQPENVLSAEKRPTEPSRLRREGVAIPSATQAMTIYLDCNATTPMEPEVLRVVRHYLEIDFGNAGSRTHEYGLRAKQAVDEARAEVASTAGCKPDEVVFTSGATEANNLAILGLEAEGRRSKRMHLISTQIEHKAVLEPLDEMRRRGFEVTLLRPNQHGWVTGQDLAAALRPDTLLVSIMHANNETGVIQDLPGYCAALQSHDAYFHVDAAQTFGKIADLGQQRIDMLSASAHKLYAPKGVGALIVKRRGWSAAPLRPLMFGGGQERGLRPGTHPVALIAGFGAAARLGRKDIALRNAACKQRAELIAGALRASPAFLVNGDPARLMNTAINVSIDGIDEEAAILRLRDELAVSNGAACTSSSYQPSHVLRAMYGDKWTHRGSLRLSWCHMTSTADLQKAADLLLDLPRCVR